MCPHGDGPTRTCRTSLPVSPACLSWCPHPRENTPQHPHPTLPPLDMSAGCVSSRRFQGRAGTERRPPLRGCCPLRGSPALSGPGPFILMDPAPLARGASPAPAHPALKILSANTAQEPMEMPTAGARGQLSASALWTRLSPRDLGAPSPCPHTPRPLPPAVLGQLPLWPPSSGSSLLHAALDTAHTPPGRQRHLHRDRKSTR